MLLNDVTNEATPEQPGSNEVTPQNSRNTPSTTGSSSGTDTNRPRSSRRDTRPNNVSTSTQRDFKGATPDIGGVLALRSKNVAIKTNYDKFCEKFETYLMKQLKGGEHVIEILKDPNIDILNTYKSVNKPADLTDEEKKSDVEVEIKKEEIKEFVKQVTAVKSNQKKITL